MTDEIEDLEIKIEDDKPPADVVVEKVEDKPAEPKVIEPEEGIEALKAKLADAEAGRAAEAAGRRAAEQAAAGARTEVQDSNVQLVTNAIEVLKHESAALKTKFAECLAASDFEGASEAQEEMSALAAKRLSLEGGLERMKAQPKVEAVTDPVEKLASQLTPRSAQWVRAHPECATTDRMYQRMLAAHNLALTDNLTPDTDDYFAAVERTMGLTKTQAEPAEDALSEAATPAQRRTSPPAAPVTRGGNGNGSGPTTVRLSAAEREIAQMNGLTDQEYARNKLALVKEGRMN